MNLLAVAISSQVLNCAVSIVLVIPACTHPVTTTIPVAVLITKACSSGIPPHVSPEPIVLNFGVGQQHASNLYLSLIPASEFWTGMDAQGNPATLYFTGVVNGQPTWSTKESDAVPDHMSRARTFSFDCGLDLVDARHEANRNQTSLMARFLYDHTF